MYNIYYFYQKNIEIKELKRSKARLQGFLKSLKDQDEEDDTASSMRGVRLMIAASGGKMLLNHFKERRVSASLPSRFPGRSKSKYTYDNSAYDKD